LSWMRSAVIFRVRLRAYEAGVVSFTLLIMSEYEVGRVVRGQVRFAIEKARKTLP